MDRRRIIDFGWDPIDRMLWVRLDRRPTAAWADGLLRVIDADGDRPPPDLSFEGERLYLRIADPAPPARCPLAADAPSQLDAEADALARVEAYVAAANNEGASRPLWMPYGFW